MERDMPPTMAATLPGGSTCSSKSSARIPVWLRIDTPPSSSRLAPSVVPRGVIPAVLERMGKGAPSVPFGDAMPREALDMAERAVEARICALAGGRLVFDCPSADMERPPSASPGEEARPLAAHVWRSASWGGRGARAADVGMRAWSSGTDSARSRTECSLGARLGTASATSRSRIAKVKERPAARRLVVERTRSEKPSPHGAASGIANWKLPMLSSELVTRSTGSPCRSSSMVTFCTTPTVRHESE
mmetsp:Transcript_13650/g.30636  ORF Transcript_13650/g.30636 Transcript_13650/m.30636 type:complete len:247 (-) Transcript_13650:1087-1827(-)